MPIRNPMLMILAFLGGLVFSANAWTVRTPESVALMNLRAFIRVFESEHRRLPESREELDGFLGKPVDDLYPLVLPSRRYAFFSPPVTLRFHERRSLQVVAMTRKPMWEATRTGNLGRTTALKGPGRYIVHRDQDGNLFTQWLDESRIQLLWPGTGQALPEPDREPERPWVKEARMRILLRRLGIGALIVLPICWIVSRIRKK